VRSASLLMVAVMIGAGGLAAGCGPSPPPTTASRRAAAPRCATPADSPSSARPDATLTINNADNGEVFCLKAGGHLMVFLGGTLARKWMPIHSSSTVLIPAPNGGLALKVGVTGAFFAAAHAGTARISSTRSGCKPATSRCGTPMVFHVTVVVSPRSPG
jgi:hypothetical protein